MKLKTVEIIVEEKPWDIDKDRIPANKLVGVKVNYGEIHMGEMVRATRGRWNRERKLWELRSSQVIALDLESRILME